MKANRASALVPTSRCGAFAVVGQQHHAEQGAPGRVQFGFLELRRHHLAEPFEAAGIDLGCNLDANAGGIAVYCLT
jgi:hypothetical protein